MSGFEDTPRLDRSTLERYATCPMQARLCETVVKSVGPEAVAGTEIHGIISELISDYVACGADMPRDEIMERLWRGIRASRPDVQPDVIDGFRRAIWPMAAMFVGDRENPGVMPSAIMRYDGGDGDRSGQISADISSVNAVATCEVDLLLATKVPQVVKLRDWKTGHKFWTADAVADSFQFQFYSWVILENYPDAQEVLVSIFNTRANVWTWEIPFTRERIESYRARVEHAAGLWQRWHTWSPENVEAWPMRGKCEKCPALAACRYADRDIAELTTPEKLLTRLQFLGQQSKAITKLLSDRVAATGEDIVAGDVAFGFNKPASVRKPKAALYAVAGESNDE